jgi:hypothetical protein
MIEKIGKFRILSRRMKLLFFEALFYQLIDGLILKLLPFRIISRLFALPSNLESQRDGFRAPLPSYISYEIKMVLIITGRLSPWKNKCLVQSLAARQMLSRRGIYTQICFGVTFDRSRKMVAHAWLKTYDLEVVEKNGDYQELYKF